MAVEAMIGDGTILDAITLQSYGNGSVDLSAGSFTYDDPSQTLTWTSTQGLGSGFYELIVDGGQLRDQAGVAIAGGSAGLAFQIPVYDTQALLSVAGNPIETGNFSVPSTVDWDNDQLLDLIVGEKTDSGEGKVRIYLNKGTAEAPGFTDYTYVQGTDGDLAVAASGCLGSFPRVVDWDGDGANDLLIGRADGRIEFYANVNTDEQPQFGTPVLLTVGPADAKQTIELGARATFDVVDWDADGAHDLVTGSFDGRVRVFVNQSASGAPDFLAEQVVQNGAFDLVTPSGRASVAVADLDGDGRQDLLLGNTNGEILFYANVGTKDAPAFNGYVAVETAGLPIDLPGTPRSRPFVGDFDADGKLDLLVGAGDGLVRFFEAVEWNSPYVRDAEVGAAGQPYSFVFQVTGGDWQNVSNPLDVNGDGHVESTDVERMFAELNVPTYHQQSGRRLNAVPDEGAPCYFDVDGDGYCTPLDVLLVINHLNSQAAGAEGEASTGFLSAAQPSPLDARTFSVAQSASSILSHADLQVNNDVLIGADQSDDSLSWDDDDAADIQPPNADLESVIGELVQ
jgi:WD40 repeat protein